MQTIKIMDKEMKRPNALLPENMQHINSKNETEIEFNALLNILQENHHIGRVAQAKAIQKAGFAISRTNKND